jgi:hypothetical protein
MYVPVNDPIYDPMHDCVTGRSAMRFPAREAHRLF